MTYETASIQSKAGDFPVNDRISIGAVHRQARSSHLLWRPSTFHVCCASYCFIKGVQALCFSSILRFTLIHLSLSSELSYARSIAAYFGLLKVSHVLITGFCIQWFLFPKRIASLVGFCCCMYILFLLSLSSRIDSRLNGSSDDFPVFSFSIFIIVTCLSISLHCVDACCDCLLQEGKSRAQFARKLTSFTGSLVSIALLLLPDNYALLPVVFFAICVALLGIIVSICWWLLPEHAEAAFQTMKKKSSSSVLSASQIGVIICAALISDNADQVLDTISNIQIDSFVSGGKIMAAIAKELTSMLSSSISAYCFFRSNMSRSTSIRNHFAFRTCLLWAALQLCRLFIYRLSSLDTFSEIIGVIVILIVTLSEKVAGSVFECSRVQIEAEWIVSVSLYAVHGQSSPVVFSPIFWMSVSEVVSHFSGSILKLGVGWADLANRHVFLTVAVLFLLICTICLQVFMIQGILNKKRC